jgi:hypothetical protein
MKNVLLYLLVGLLALFALPIAFAVAGALLGLALKALFLVVIGWALVKAARGLMSDPAGSEPAARADCCSRCGCAPPAPEEAEVRE